MKQVVGEKVRSFPRHAPTAETLTPYDQFIQMHSILRMLAAREADGRRLVPGSLGGRGCRLLRKGQARAGQPPQVSVSVTEKDGFWIHGFNACRCISV